MPLARPGLRDPLKSLAEVSYREPLEELEYHTVRLFPDGPVVPIQVVS